MMRRFVLPDAPPDHTPVDALRMNHDRPGHASDDAAPTQLADVEPPGVHIRPVTSLAEFRACVALQAEVWGSAYTDAVPASLMQVATKHAGAVVLGAFTNTDLEAQLKTRGVTQLVIAGVSTSNGVEATARYAYELGFNVTLAIDAMTDLNLDSHTHSITRIFPKLGETGTTAEIIGLLQERA